MRVLRNARLADGSDVDVFIDPAGGTISSVTDSGSAEIDDAAEIDDLRGWLLLPAMAEPHAHLDKALTADEVPNPKGDLMGAIEAWFQAAEDGRLSYGRTVERATQAFEMLLVHGVTAVRTHINVTADIGIASVLAVQEAARAMEGLIDFQMVALTGWPMTGPDSAANVRALEEAVEAGVDLVGGCPNLQDDPPAHIADVLALATSAGIDIDLHTDETLDASVLTLRELARQVGDKGFDGSVAASHCVSLGMQPPDVQEAVATEVAAAGISVITLPQTNLFLQGRDDPQATPRGLTAINALLDAGALVAAGADNVQDPFNLVGRSDPLETAALMVMAGHRLPADAYDMVTNTARRVMGLPPVNFEPGDPADLVAIDAASLRGAVADAPMSRRVYRRGRLVASADQQTQVLR
ncbi:MAG: amidohydrolase family protein [Acidimicrobiaceae bacterium]|nr:amidohydrolase family protein [Acidimicrobiaceae bacterium]MYE08636.1 amidohydrolase family protein [Acidimicrobiaceae bacterium]MYI35457.1 amidohydrolase family protein [Acidimicrobiaceae bacterium]